MYFYAQGVCAVAQWVVLSGCATKYLKHITEVKRWPELLKTGCADGYGEATFFLVCFPSVLGKFVCFDLIVCFCANRLVQ